MITSEKNWGCENPRRAMCGICPAGCRVKVAYDSEGKPLNLVVTRNEIRIPAKDYPSMQRGGLQIHREIDVPQAEVFLRTGIYDLRSDNAGTLGIPLAAVAGFKQVSDSPPK